MVPNTGDGATQGKVQTHHNIKEKLIPPNSEQISSHHPTPQVATARGDASLLLSPSMMGSSDWEPPWLGLSLADPRQLVTQRQLV